MNNFNFSNSDITSSILSVCKMLHSKNFLAGADGNVSYKLADNSILITPSGRPKAFICEENLALIDLEGNIISGKPSAERAMHLAIYKKCSQAKAIVHAHTPSAVAWSIARPDMKELPQNVLPEVILAAGRIPIVPYTIPTTEAMGQALEDYLPDHRLLILSRHGAVSWGETLEEAYMGIERIEHAAETLRLAVSLGGLSEISSQDFETLKKMRKKIGERTL